MHSYIVSALSALAIALPVSATLSARVPTTQGTILKPIAIRDFEAAAGLQRRQDSEDFSDLDTKTQAELIYGSPGDNGQLLLANMTLYAEDGLEIVLMERFEGLTSAVDCKGDDGQMSLTFSNQNAFQYALQQWAFINSKDDGSFLLIANHDGCGPDNERQPYIISKVTEDTASLTTYLDAKPAPWEDVTATYDLDFGHVTPYKQTSKLKGRSILGDIEGDFDVSKTVNVDVSAGTKGQVSNIYTSDKFTLDCVNCFTTGSFALTGHISTHHWSLTALTLSAAPQDVSAELELEAKINAGASPAKLQYEKELIPNTEIPGAGLSIPKIFSLGASIAYDVGITTSFQGTADVDFGVSAGIPNSASLVADLVNFDSSSAGGWGGGSLTPIFDVKQMSASVTLGAYSKPKLSFGVQIIKIGQADVDISVKLPEVDVTLTADYDAAGVCTGNPSKTGIKLDSSWDIEVDLDITAKFGDNDAPSYSKPLFTLTEPIASQCFPLNIPGLGPASTSQPPSSVSTIASTQSPSVTASHVYSPSGGPSIVPIVNGTSFIIAPSGASIPYSKTAATGGPSLSGTSRIVGPSGSGGIPLSTGVLPPYPYSTGPSGISKPTGTGSPSGSGRPPYPFPSGASSSITTTLPSGTSYPSTKTSASGAPLSTGLSSLKTSVSGAPLSTGLSSLKTSVSSAPLSTGLSLPVPSPSSTLKPSTSATVSSSSSPSGTLGVQQRIAERGVKSPPIKRAVGGAEEGCRMEGRFGKRVLVC